MKDKSLLPSTQTSFPLANLENKAHTSSNVFVTVFPSLSSITMGRERGENSRILQRSLARQLRG